MIRSGSVNGKIKRDSANEVPSQNTRRAIALLATARQEKPECAQSEESESAGLRNGRDYQVVYEKVLAGSSDAGCEAECFIAGELKDSGNETYVVNYDVNNLVFIKDSEIGEFVSSESLER